MLKSEQIPFEVAEAAQREMVDGPIRETWIDHYREAIAAALNAWPGMTMLGPHSSGHGRSEPALILPLPTEASDE